MIINTAGEYTLQYTATDACGNSTTVERDLVVEAPPRTVLYTDGTFIINELGTDQAANTALHGQPTNVYAPFDPNGATDVDKYIFASISDRPWNAQRASVTSVEIGSEISPTSTAYWFNGFAACTSMSLDNIDTSAVVDMKNMFESCKALTSLDLSNFVTSSVSNMTLMFYDCIALDSINLDSFDTSSVTTMSGMFQLCKAIQSLDLSGFDTSSVTSMNRMFNTCNALITIYASASFVVSQVTDSAYMFTGCTNLVGGEGTPYSSSYVDKTRARIDGGASYKGYFTAKS